ncbi:MAG TPA: caspase family protein [Kofleriaceae bacterium]|nr:caspase family protein [Kofleriaceae bacterium]
MHRHDRSAARLHLHSGNSIASRLQQVACQELEIRMQTTESSRVALRPQGSKAKGISLHIGLNSVDPRHYQGWSGPLQACEADADDMKAIAVARGFSSQQLLTAAATRNAVREAITNAAANLAAGDIFFISYSGHGGQVPDRNSDEEDAQDETWCLYDAQLIDDELYALWRTFAPGVRILVLSDSCHSGTMAKQAFLSALNATGVLHALLAPAGEQPAIRAMPDAVAQRVYRGNREFYDALQDKLLGDKSGPSPRASVLLISGCQDNQTSADGAFNGLFTSNLLRVWKQGSFTGDYRAFHKAIGDRMPPVQSPNYYRTGAPDSAFDAQAPFTI